MAEKKEIKNKSEKKTSKTKVIDWSKVESHVVVIALKGNNLVEGKEYPVTKEIAKILIGAKKATLK